MQCAAKTARHMNADIMLGK